MKPKHGTREGEAEEVRFLPGPMPASLGAWARGFIYMAGLEPVADERTWIVSDVWLIIKPPLQGFLPPLVCVSIWSKFKQRFRPLHFLGLINNS